MSGLQVSGNAMLRQLHYERQMRKASTAAIEAHTVSEVEPRRTCVPFYSPRKLPFSSHPSSSSLSSLPLSLFTPPASALPSSSSSSLSPSPSPSPSTISSAAAHYLTLPYVPAATSWLSAMPVQMGRCLMCGTSVSIGAACSCHGRLSTPSANPNPNKGSCLTSRASSFSPPFGFLQQQQQQQQLLPAGAPLQAAGGQQLPWQRQAQHSFPSAFSASRTHPAEQPGWAYVDDSDDSPRNLSFSFNSQ